MTLQKRNSDPPRLAESSSAAGELLRENLREARGASEDVAWRKLQARITARKTAPGLPGLPGFSGFPGLPGFGAWWVVAAVGAGLALVLFLSPSRSELKVSADPALVARAQEGSPSTGATLAFPTADLATADLTTADLATAALERGGPESKSSDARAVPSAHAISTAPSHKVAEATRPNEQQPSDNLENCAGLARQGEYTSAVTCYQQLSEGSSLAAEFALYEQARLESRVLGDEARALQTLNALRQRFPHGSLEVETALSRIELLTHLGNSDGALSAIEQALASRARAERGADLLTLKSELLLRRGDCAGFLTAKRAALDAGAKVERLPLGAACEQPAPSGSLPQ